MTPALLLAVAAAAVILPEHMAAWLGGSHAAWAYVLSGVEAAALWCALGVVCTHALVRAVCLWGVFEAAQRPVCRLAFPMDKPPPLQPGQSLCDAALGVPMSAVSVAAALALAALVQEAERA